MREGGGGVVGSLRRDRGKKEILVDTVAFRPKVNGIDDWRGVEPTLRLYLPTAKTLIYALAWEFGRLSLR